MLLTEATATLGRRGRSHRPRSASAQGLRRAGTAVFSSERSATRRSGRPGPCSSRPRRPGSSVASASSTTPCRLVLTETPPILTIIGPGGTGKTRFSIELSRLLAEDADGGTVFVPLAALRDPTLVLPAIAGRPRRGRRVAGWDRRTDRRATHAPAPGQRRATPPGRGGDACVPRCAGPFAPAPRNEPRGAERRRRDAVRPASARARGGGDLLRGACEARQRRGRADAGRDDAVRAPRPPAARARACGRPDAPPAAPGDPRAPRGSPRPPCTTRRRSPPRDAAGDDRLVARSPLARRAEPVRELRDLPRRLHARSRGGGLRRGPRHPRVADRQEPRAAARRRERIGPLLDARDDPRVRRREARRAR